MATDAPTALPRLATAATISEETGIPVWRIYELVRADQLPHVRIGRAVRFNRRAVTDWIAAGGTGYHGPEAA